MPMPSRRFPVTRRSRYLASSGVARAEQPAQQLQLAPLRALPLRRRDLAQGAHHGGDVQAGRAARRGFGQQLLGGLPQVAGLPDGRRDVRGLGADGDGERPDGHLLGQPQVDPGELRRDLPLAQVAHGGQQFGRSLRHQLRHPLDQHQPPAGLLEVTVGLGHDQVFHNAPFPHLIMTRRPPSTLPPPARARPLRLPANVRPQRHHGGGSYRSFYARESTCRTSP